ncbi:MAG: hypothetical protein IPM16_07130 [Chloroflexi bacterium]|nr:hypothetical protein [Chloroflexota bacterium]
MTETTPEPIVVKPPMTVRGCLWRAGCLIIWFPLILLPIVLLALAVQGEIALWHRSDFPDSHEHPFLQAKLLMDIDTRGLNLTRSFIASGEGSDAVCVQTYVSYMLWQGEGEPSSYCDCYARSGERWALQSTAAGDCPG